MYRKRRESARPAGEELSSCGCALVARDEAFKRDRSHRR